MPIIQVPEQLVGLAKFLQFPLKLVFGEFSLQKCAKSKLDSVNKYCLLFLSVLAH